MSYMVCWTFFVHYTFFATISVKKNKFYLIWNSSADVFRILNSWQIPDITNLTKIYKRCIAIYRKILQWKKYFVTSYRMQALWYTYLKNRNLCLTLWHVHLIPLLVGHWNLRNLVTSTCVNLQEGIYGKMWVANAFLYTYVLSFLHFITLPKIKMLLFPEKVALLQIASQKAQPIIGSYIWKLKCKMHMLEKIVYISLSGSLKGKVYENKFKICNIA